MGERDKSMDFNLNENQRMYLETVRRFVKSEILPNILEMEKLHEFPGGIIRKAWELGLLNLSVPASVTGFDIDAVSAALIIKELSYGDTGISTSAMCNDLANVVIAQHGSEEQKRRFLEPFVNEPRLASFCLTEPGRRLRQFIHAELHREIRRRLRAQRVKDASSPTRHTLRN